MKTKPYLGGCTQIRRRLVTHATVSLATGETKTERTEWETAACNAPLFSDAERERRTCRSCANGWTHPHNYPVDEAAP
jgi:hypothetical protein